ncbi:MAG: SMC-Scp complex subunit ScpB [Patescibacteria group bacterium]
MGLSQKIEAILFYKTDAITVKSLASILGVTESEAENGLRELAASLSERGINLVRTKDEVMLTTSKETSPFIEKIAKEELEGELSKASVETLAVILYSGGATKSDIDYIRGVNSGFMLRNLQIRGLIEKKANPKDGRSFIYVPTMDIYRYLGISKKEELPEYSGLIESIDSLSEEKGN